MPDPYLTILQVTQICCHCCAQRAGWSLALRLPPAPAPAPASRCTKEMLLPRPLAVGTALPVPPAAAASLAASRGASPDSSSRRTPPMALPSPPPPPPSGTKPGSEKVVQYMDAEAAETSSSTSQDQAIWPPVGGGRYALLTTNRKNTAWGRGNAHDPGPCIPSPLWRAEMYDSR